MNVAAGWFLANRAIFEAKALWCRKFEPDPFHLLSMSKPRLWFAGFAFHNAAAIWEQCMCPHGFGFVMAMGNDYPLPMADGICHRLFNIRCLYVVGVIAGNATHHTSA